MHEQQTQSARSARQRWKRRASIVALLAASGVMGAVGCGGDEPKPRTDIAQPNNVIKQRVEAGELSKQLLGAAALDVTYQKLPNGAPLVRVVALDAAGVKIGELVVDGSAKTAPISFTARDGSTASAVAAARVDDSGVATKAVTYRANGAYFTVASEHQAGQLVAVTYSTGNGEAVSSKRLPTPDTAGFSERVNEWTAGNPHFAVLDSTRALREMYVLGMDSAWQNALGGLFDSTEAAPHQHPAGLGTNQQGIHKSPLCSQFMAVIAAGGVAALACTACGPAGVAIFFSKGLAAFIAIPACLTCVIAVGLSVADLAFCMTSYWNALDAATCAAQAPPWADGTLDVNEHSCTNTCNIQKCQAYCTQQGQGSNTCVGNACSCVPQGTGGTTGGGSGGSGGGTGGVGGGTQICIACTSGQCGVDSSCGTPVYCSGSCPADYECQYGGCVRTTVTVCECDGSDPPGTCLDCYY